MIRPGRLVDVHAHCLPRAYLAAVRHAGLTSFDGGYAIPSWTVEGAVRFMDRHGIGLQVLSVSSPPVCVLAGVDTVAGLARAVNDDLAEIVAQRPGLFRGAATLPLPDVPAAVDEVYRTLGGPAFAAVALFTNYAGIYLGDPEFDPVFAALDDLGAVVVLHPTSPVCADQIRLSRPSPVLEFPLDTTRAVANLVYTGTLTRHPHIQFVVPHAGGAIPTLASRIARFAAFLPDTGGATAAGVLDQLRRLHYDLAMSVDQHALAALLTLAGPERMLFGSDFPFAPTSAITDGVHELATSSTFTDNQREDIGYRNALRLFPELAVVPAAPRSPERLVP